ncbi:alpha/beta fold hydrolase [Paraconexibacter sp. AEG42_29]|uniref:alpha/beta fold hydrolase n=1 Tax=Paraconexibacter sp. AEG42_29 TaxID=2997339 RepID=UPI00339D7CFF
MLDRSVRYVDYGSGPPFLLVHGLGGSWQTWLENIPALAGAGHRVVAVDLPGFGGSDVLAPGATFDAHSATLLALIDALALPPVIVVGHSMGGLATIRLALGAPERVAGLVLACAGGIALSERRLALIVRGFQAFNGLFSPAALRAVARRPRLRRLVFRLGLYDTAGLSGQLAREIVPLMATPGFSDALVAGAHAAADSGADRLEGPTLLVWGANDRILPVAQAEALAASLPDARLMVLERCGHCPMFERPAGFNSALVGFASELEAAPRAASSSRG